MKKLLLVLMLATITSQAQSAVLCQSMKDYQFKAWFEGYSCPSGFYYLRSQ